MKLHRGIEKQVKNTTSRFEIILFKKFTFNIETISFPVLSLGYLWSCTIGKFTSMTTMVFHSLFAAVLKYLGQRQEREKQ